MNEVPGTDTELLARLDALGDDALLLLGNFAAEAPSPSKASGTSPMVGELADWCAWRVIQWDQDSPAKADAARSIRATLGSAELAFSCRMPDGTTFGRVPTLREAIALTASRQQPWVTTGWVALRDAGTAVDTWRGARWYLYRDAASMASDELSATPRAYAAIVEVVELESPQPMPEQTRGAADRRLVEAGERVAADAHEAMTTLQGGVMPLADLAAAVAARLESYGAPEFLAWSTLVAQHARYHELELELRKHPVFDRRAGEAIRWLGHNIPGFAAANEAPCTT